MTIQDILRPFNLTVEELNKAEVATLTGILQQVKEHTLSVDDVKKGIAAMKESVELELTKPDLDKNQDIFLKARLRNYVLLEAYLTASDKATELISRQLKKIADQKGK